MKTTPTNIFLTVVLLLSTDCFIWSQHAAMLLPAQSSVIIKGTSSWHDWEEKVEKFNVNMDLILSDKEVTGIDRVQFTCKSGSIVSENSIMTNKTHNALQVDKYPDIVFRLVSVDNLTSQNGTFSGTLLGDVILAGVTKRIKLTFSGINNGNRLSIKGSKELNMNDFNIKPPTAMMGALKTDGQVMISFLLNFQVSQSTAFIHQQDNYNR